MALYPGYRTYAGCIAIYFLTEYIISPPPYIEQINTYYKLSIKYILFMKCVIQWNSVRKKFNHLCVLRYFL